MIAEHYLGMLADRVELVRVATSLREMRAALDVEPFDVVLLDLTLPDSPLEDTLEALGTLREQYGDRFVLMSSLGTSDIARRAIESGASAFLSKLDVRAESLREVLDAAHLPGPVSGSGPLQAAAGDPAASMADAPASEREATLEIDGPALASKIAHDALGWIANITFRASHMDADPAVQASNALQADVSSLRQSAEALTSFVNGSLALLKGELSAGESSGSEGESIDLGSWLPAFIERWKKSTRDRRLTVHLSAASTVQVPSAPGARVLSGVLSALLHNALQHSPHREGEIAVTIREEPAAGTHAVLLITDDGGPWRVADASLLGTPLGTGTKGAPSAGLGLFNARRSVESLGGAMTIVERPDAPGAYGIRLVLPRR